MKRHLLSPVLSVTAGAALAAALIVALPTAALAASASAPRQVPIAKASVPATLEVVSELPMRPGNVTPGPGGRVFATVHPLDAPNDAQLIEITGPGQFKPWPTAALQRGKGASSDDRIDSPLGINVDAQGRLWIIDMGLQLGKTRLWAFDVKSGKVLHRIELPASIAPKGSFVQDLTVDARRGWVYLADIAQPGLIAVEIASGRARRFSGHPSLQAEPDARMVIGGQAIQFQGKPANVGVNPVTLSADGETLFFGAMNGRNWYALPARLLREGASDEKIGAAIRRAGPKPVSDGAATDAQGRHYFTNLNEGGVDRLDADGQLREVVRDPRIVWPDSVHIGGDWLYISVNQLHRTPAFTGGEDQGQPPYRVMRMKVGGTGK